MIFLFILLIAFTFFGGYLSATTLCHYGTSLAAASTADGSPPANSLAPTKPQHFDDLSPVSNRWLRAEFRHKSSGGGGTYDGSTV